MNTFLSMNLNSFFYPTSIAVVGASTKVGSVGNDVVKNLTIHNYQGKIYPVNPHTTEIYNLSCFASLRDIQKPIELAILIIPAKGIPEALEDAGKLGIHSAVIISSGFKESGAAGQELEKTIQMICKQYNITLLGPNCLGFINTEISVNASFAPLMPEIGNISLLSQSGALCTAILDAVQTHNLGFSKFISTGNKAGLNENTLLKYLAQDEGTRVIAMYTEEIVDAQDIIQTGRGIIARSTPKPIIALKAGLTDAGASASASHTGSLGSSASAYYALFKQSKIIQAHTLGEFLNLLFVFSRNSLPEGNRVAIITNAGGPGVLATDTATTCGLALAKLLTETETALKEFLPASAGVHNPIDVLGDALSDRYEAALQTVSADPGVDMMLIILTPQSMTDIEHVAEAIIDLKKKSKKPVVATFIGETLVGEARKKLHAAGVAHFSTPEECAMALGALAQVSQWSHETLSQVPAFTDVHKDSVRTILNNVRESGRKNLFETEVLAVLEAYQFPLLKSAVAKSVDDARAIAVLYKDKHVALKIISPDITHKSDAGGVMLGIEATAIPTAYEELLQRVHQNKPEAKLDGVLVVEMAQTGGKEIILGTKKEAGLGTMLMFGLGGIYVETFKDVSFRFTPMTQADTQEMVQEIKTYPLLAGTRGEQGIDQEKLIEYIGRLSQLVTDFPEIAECDINPLLTFPNGSDFKVLDGRIMLAY